MGYRVYWIQKYGYIEKSIDVSSKELAERLVRTLNYHGDTARCEPVSCEGGS